MCSTVIYHLIHFYQPSWASVAPNELNCGFLPKIDHFWAISETQPLIQNVKKWVHITRVSPQSLLKPLKLVFTWKTDIALIPLHCPIWHTVLHHVLACIVINNVIIVIILMIIMILLILLIIITSWLWGERCLSDVGKRSARSWCHHQILQAAQSWSNSAFVKTLTTQNFVSDLFRIFQMNISVVSSFERKWIELSISVMNSVCSETHSWQNRMRSFYSSSTLVLKKG